MSKAPFESEADLVAAFCASLEPRGHRKVREWTPYHETAGWDLLLVHVDTGAQVGIEAKMSLNAKVLEQALPGHWTDPCGPDYRAVLVPQVGKQLHLETIARHLGIVIITARDKTEWGFHPYLPNPESQWSYNDWPNWCPDQRCRLPDYIPDVTGGKAAPVSLTPWKIKAIKLLIILERRGWVTRGDMKKLDISPSRWTDHYHGFLDPDPRGGYRRSDATPDLKAQHPVNWAQIEADAATWGKDFGL